MISCPAARALLDGYLADSLSAADAARLGEHVRACPACAARLGSLVRLADLLRGLPVVEPSAGFEERQLAAAIADRLRRHEQRSWLSQLRLQVFRGALRTTGTLAATIAAVALLGGAFVLAATALFPGVGQRVLPGRTLPPSSQPAIAVAGPTSTPAPQVTQPEPTQAIVAPATRAPSAAPETPSPTRSPAATPRPTPAPTPTPVVIVVAPTAAPSASPTPSPTPSPSPTPKPRRCPPGTPCYSPAPGAGSSASRLATPSPSP